ncbi:unnamed protein product [Caenorhabditis auriculariae]|uniref:Uncharacterized protein n=1 Tax=Caenorhabditis auriculariae TaxID=2777116 RepID=A0A8S1GNE8_9PELO|nr:unnamed protein product [Caenorhabditis auriculariae]
MVVQIKVIAKQPVDILSERWANSLQLRTENKVTLLAWRELGTIHRRGRQRLHGYHSPRQFYPTLKLEKSEAINLDVATPSMACLFLAWTPDGKRMIATCNLHKTIRILRYKGVEGGMGKNDEALVKGIFDVEHDVNLVSTAENGFAIRSELTLFTHDSKHLLICTMGHATEPVAFHHAYRSNESFPINIALDMYYFHVIDIEEGKVCGEHRFNADKISLVSGVSLNDRTLLILSQHHQVLTVFSLSQAGDLFVEREIGASIHEDDSLFLWPHDPGTYVGTLFYTGFKQRLTTFLYKRAKEQGDLVKFHQRMIYRQNLRMMRAQLLGGRYVFLRMATKPPNGHVDYSSQPCFFVLFDWRTVEIIDVFEEYDARLLLFFEGAIDEMVHPSQTYFTDAPLTFRHNYFAHLNYQRSKSKESKSEVVSGEVCRRLLNPLPLYCTQVSVASPFLDPYLFSIDESFFRSVLGGRVQVRLDAPGGNQLPANPVQYFSRRTGRLLFSFQLPSRSSGKQVNLLSCLFPIFHFSICLLYHPTDPLFIGVERSKPENKIFVYMPRSDDELPQEPSDDF